MKVYGQLEYAQLEQVVGIGALLGPATAGRLVQDTTSSSATVPLFYNGTAWVTVLMGGNSTAAVAANLLYGGPASGSAALPTFRSAVQLDLPNVVTAGYFYGYFPGSASNYWSLTSATYADYTANGAIPAITQPTSVGFGTVAGAASSLPGVLFTAVRTGVVEVTATCYVTSSTGTIIEGVRLIDATSATVIALWSQSVVSTAGQQIVLKGFFAVTATTAYTFKVQGKTASGTGAIGGVAVDCQLSFTMRYI